MWGAFMQRDNELQHRVNPHEAFGVMGNYDMDTGEFDYVAGFEVTPVEVPEGMVRWDVPPGNYAVFPCTIPTIGDVIHRAHHTWLPDSGYKHGETPEFEFYPKEFDPQVPDSQLFVYIPIQKA
jgi:AraC family transcriptional regulator